MMNTKKDISYVTIHKSYSAKTRIMYVEKLRNYILAHFRGATLGRLVLCFVILNSICTTLDFSTEHRGSVQLSIGLELGMD